MLRRDTLIIRLNTSHIRFDIVRKFNDGTTFGNPLCIVKTDQLYRHAGLYRDVPEPGFPLVHFSSRPFGCYCKQQPIPGVEGFYHLRNDIVGRTAMNRYAAKPAYQGPQRPVDMPGSNQPGGLETDCQSTRVSDIKVPHRCVWCPDHDEFRCTKHLARDAPPECKQQQTPNRSAQEIATLWGQRSEFG